VLIVIGKVSDRLLGLGSRALFLLIINQIAREFGFV